MISGPFGNDVFSGGKGIDMEKSVVVVVVVVVEERLLGAVESSWSL